MVMNRHRLFGMILALLTVVMVTVVFAPVSVAAQEPTARNSRQLLLELRGKPLNWFSFTVAEYYIDDVDQEDGGWARDIINDHMNGSIWRFYDDGTLEFIGGAGMPVSLKYLSGSYEYDAENDVVEILVGRPGLEPNLTLSAIGFGGIYNPESDGGNIMLLYAANYNQGGHWHFVTGAFSQNVRVTYPR
jgi:hypothetical protein